VFIPDHWLPWLEIRVEICLMSIQNPRLILETSRKMFLNKSLTNSAFRGASINGGERLLFSCLSVRSSVRPSVRRYNLFLSGGIFTKFNIRICFENLTRKFKLTVTVHEHKYTYFILSHAVFRTRNVSDKLAEKIKTYIFC